MKITPLQEKLHRLGRRATRGLIAIAILLLVLDVVLHRHGKIALEDKLFFPAVYGFASFFIIVGLAIIVKKVIKKREDYYD